MRGVADLDGRVCSRVDEARADGVTSRVAQTRSPPGICCVGAPRKSYRDGFTSAGQSDYCGVAESGFPCTFVAMPSLVKNDPGDRGRVGEAKAPG